jgi:hypothetical protein
MQMAPYLIVDELVVLAESIVRKHIGVFLSDFIQLENSAPFHGRDKCVQAISLLRGGAASSQETRLRLQLIGHGLPMPTIDYEPGLFWSTGFPMKFDLAYPEQKILIEYDGRHHSQIEEQGNNDNFKRLLAAAKGWKIAVVDSKGMRNIDKTCEMIRQLFG